jgi:hypothetical protein
MRNLLFMGVLVVWALFRPQSGELEGKGDQRQQVAVDPS